MRWRLTVCLGAAVAAMAVYVNSLSGEFVWDDTKLIVENPQVRSWDQLDQIFTHDFFHLQQGEIV